MRYLIDLVVAFVFMACITSAYAVPFSVIPPGETYWLYGMRDGASKVVIVYKGI